MRTTFVRKQLLKKKYKAFKWVESGQFNIAVRLSMSENRQEAVPRERRHGSVNQQQQHKKKFEGPKREAIIDLSKYKNTEVRVKLMGGRQLKGVLKGFDPLMNLVLDETVEYMRDIEDLSIINSEETRKIGLTVIRSTVLLLLSPVDGSEIIYSG